MNPKISFKNQTIVLGVTQQIRQKGGKNVEYHPAANVQVNLTPFSVKNNFGSKIETSEKK